MVNRIYVEKLSQYDSATAKLRADVATLLGIELTGLRRFLRYDVEGVQSEVLNTARVSIFSEPPLDVTYDNLDFLSDKQLLVVQYLDGQFDQRADSAAQCVQLLTAGTRPLVRCATVYAFDCLEKAQYESVKKYLINPVDSTEGSLELPLTLAREKTAVQKMRLEQEGFTALSAEELAEFYSSAGFAMTIEDLAFVQSYFKAEGREPTVTELRVIDTYWSDHCRHTTFLTEITDVKIIGNNPNIAQAYQSYSQAYKKQYAGRADKYPCLMDVATLAAKVLRREGYLDNLDVSDEINACSVVVKVDDDGVYSDWLIMFKNETHNHPTEIEPFGGAATCLGGAIRDPLSGRTYVYQAMRVTGAANPLEDVSATLKGKLPQRVLTKTALAGFSSYGNQIGLATGTVHELYNDGYKAKRLETGYVIGGAPKENVIRRTPQNGDIVLLVGGDTGRDGCGGATGSSKAHTEKSVALCGAEVQKGNAPEERKLQRLFRNPKAASLIIKCNDFGAGGVSVAIGELADGIDIFLDKVNKKYDGLNATELAISESQERMAVVIPALQAEEFAALARQENLKVARVAVITDTARLRMFYGSEVIADVKRSFLDTNGVKQRQQVIVREDKTDYFDCVEEDVAAALQCDNVQEAAALMLSKLHTCSQKGAGEVFDSTIGASSVLMPFGGKTQLTPSQIMASKPPVKGVTHTVTCSSFGIYPSLMQRSAYCGAIYSIVGAVSKLVASGVKYDTIRLTLQEFFMKLLKDPQRWGVPTAALLGAFEAQLGLKLGAIGGKDSMSGSFENIDVPPTLIAFAMGITTDDKVIHNAFEKGGYVYRFPIKKDTFGQPDFAALTAQYALIERLIAGGEAVHGCVAEEGGILAALLKGCFGNGMGMDIRLPVKELFTPNLGEILLVCRAKQENGVLIGTLKEGGNVTVNGAVLDVAALQKAFCAKLEPVFATTAKAEGEAVSAVGLCSLPPVTFASSVKCAKPRVFIPVFPGTNCEYDTAAAFRAAGAQADVFVVKNQSSSDIEQSIAEMKRLIDNAQLIAFPGGFSGGDEPDGSGKFIATAFRNPALKESVERLLYNRDGLIIGICNGFQALIKLGLLPYGRIGAQDAHSPTLTYNNIARHVSTIAEIQISSINSPWLCDFEVGSRFKVPVSHGEGKFICTREQFSALAAKGQIATQYVDQNGAVTMLSPFNPNGSVCGVEGILSPDGRVFGKMGHTERCKDGLYRNVPGNYAMGVFNCGVKYYS